MYKNLYGSTWIASRYCNFECPPNEPEVLWMHGWVWEDILHEEQLFGTSICSRNYRLFVANQWQKNLLEQFGYKNVQAIGLPVVYLQNKKNYANKKSLIVMPAHNIIGMQHNSKREKEYVDYIKSIQDNFETIIVSINAYDYGNGNWKNSFEKAGIKTVCGVYDGPSALQEQKDRMESFSHMTTNMIGSHVVYAGSLGLKVSISGPYFEYLKASLESIEFYRKHHKDILENAIQRSTEKYWRSKAPWLFKKPHEAVECKLWAMNEVGYQYKKSPRQLRLLMGWDFISLAKNRIYKLMN